MKTHVLIISEWFPKTHARAGEPTLFGLSIKYYDKIHTIRDNYDYWEPKIKEVQQGKAILSVRVWSAKPYNSKQKEIFRYDHTHGIGIESIRPHPLGWVINNQLQEDLTTKTIAKNDGLSLEDFKEWFKGSFDVDGDDKAIIHFTSFRYAS